MDDNIPKKVGRPRRKAMADKQKAAIVKAVTLGDEKAIARAVENHQHTPAVFNRGVTDEHCEVVLVRVAAGATLRQVCEEMKISAALVRQRAYDNPAFGQRLREARRASADSQFEEMLEIARDPTLSVAERRLIVEVLEKMAKAHNRGLYGDKVQVDTRQVTINLTPDDRDLT